MAMASATGGDQKLSSLECAICFEKYKSAVKIPKVINCGHTFCGGCIESLIKNNRLECPKCRKIFPIASQVDQFPTNFDLLSLVDEEDNRAKSCKYNCTDCSIGLTVDKAFLCKNEHGGVICIDCYSSNHLDHGGISSLNALLKKHRPKFDQSLKRLKEKREKYETWTKHLNDFISAITEDLRTEIDVIKRVLDEDESHVHEKLITSGWFSSFVVDCNAEIGEEDSVLEWIRDELDCLESTLSEKSENENTSDDDDSWTETTADRLLPYLELWESSVDGDGSGDQAQETQIAGPSSSNTAASIDGSSSLDRGRQEITTDCGGDGASTSGQALFGMGGVASSATQRGRGRGRGRIPTD